MLGCNELGPEGEEAEQARQSLLAVRASAALQQLAVMLQQ